MKEQTLQEWLQEGKTIFGNDFKNWWFVCPSCGHIASIQDFIDLGYDGNLAYQECIGRVNGNRKQFNKDNAKGCDWAAYGLFGTCGKGRVVINENGKKVEVFDFAECKEVEK